MKQTYSILGDSISTFNGFIPSTHNVFYPREGYEIIDVNQTWWKIVETKLNLTLQTNDSFSGSRVTISGLKPTWASFLERSKSLKGDIIFIFGGTNDFIHPDRGTPTLQEFTEAYQQVLKSLKANNTSSKIICLLPLKRLDYSFDEPNDVNWTQRDLANTIKSLAKENNASIIDLGQITITKDNGVLTDHVHPSIKGMKLIAELIIKELKDIL